MALTTQNTRMTNTRNFWPCVICKTYVMKLNCLLHIQRLMVAAWSGLLFDFIFLYSITNLILRIWFYVFWIWNTYFEFTYLITKRSENKIHKIENTSSRVTWHMYEFCSKLHDSSVIGKRWPTNNISYLWQRHSGSHHDLLVLDTDIFRQGIWVSLVFDADLAFDHDWHEAAEVVHGYEGCQTGEKGHVDEQIRHVETTGRRHTWYVRIKTHRYSLDGTTENAYIDRYSLDG